MNNDENDLITWNEKVICGINLIDDQHRKLIELVNEMFNHVTGNDIQEHNYFNSVIQEAVKYVKLHFATEEKIMFVTKFMGYAEHKKEHEDFLNTILDNIHDYEEGKNLTLSTFTIFLKDWILSHITLIDRQYIDYLRKKPVKNTE